MNFLLTLVIRPIALWYRYRIIKALEKSGIGSIRQIDIHTWIDQSSTWTYRVTISNEALGVTRNVIDYGDIAFLETRNVVISHIERCLMRAQIPFYSVILFEFNKAGDAVFSIRVYKPFHRPYLRGWLS